MARRRAAKKAADEEDFDLAIGITPQAGSETITARKAGGLVDLKLCVSPRMQKPAIALRNMAKALNLALKMDFLETELDGIYKVARVREGAVRILHKEYFGLGDGMSASLGRTVRSFQLTLRGPDAASPEGEEWIEQNGGGALSGVLNLIGRKLNLLREFEDKVPLYVEQTLDRLEAKRTVTDWHREEWTIETTTVGLDVIIRPVEESAEA